MTVIVGEEYDSCTGIILGSYFDGIIVFYGIDATASYPRYEYHRAGTENLHLTHPLPSLGSPSLPCRSGFPVVIWRFEEGQDNGR